MSRIDSCIHCQRLITDAGEPGPYLWIDPNATGDDAVWREGCDENDSFIANHEPDEAQGVQP